MVEASQVTVGDLVQPRGDGGLRPDDEIGIPVLGGQIPVTLQGFIPKVRGPFAILGHITLHQSDLQRLARRPGPSQLSQPISAQPDGCNEGRGDQRVAPARLQHHPGQRAGADGHGKTHPQYAEHRGIPRKGAIGLGVAQGQPGVAGEEPTSEPLHGHPHGRQAQRHIHEVGPPPQTPPQPPHQQEVQRRYGSQQGAEHHAHEPAGAVAIDTDEHPRGTGAVVGHAVDEHRPQGTPARSAGQHEEQDRGRKDRHRHPTEGRECEGNGETCQQGRKQPPARSQEPRYGLRFHPVQLCFCSVAEGAGPALRSPPLMTINK